MERPRLICMDEPSMGLSPLYVEQVFDIIQAINRQGTTIFMVEQNAAMALQIAHRAYVLQTGVMVLSGTAEKLRRNEIVMTGYIAVLSKRVDSDFEVEFPDFPGCIIAGVTLDDARQMVAEALLLYVEGLMEDGHFSLEPSGLDETLITSH